MLRTQVKALLDWSTLALVKALDSVRAGATWAKSHKTFIAVDSAFLVGGTFLNAWGVHMADPTLASTAQLYGSSIVGGAFFTPSAVLGAHVAMKQIHAKSEALVQHENQMLEKLISPDAGGESGKAEIVTDVVAANHRPRAPKG